MGRPVKKEILGTAVDNEANALIIDSAYIPGSDAVSSKVKILKQKGTRTYEVTDGTNTGVVILVNKTDPETLLSGEAISIVSVNTADSGDFISASIKLNEGGSGYFVGDVITVPNAGTATVKTISNGVSGSILTGEATPATTSFDADPAETSVPSTTTGKGKGATFDVTSKSSTSFTPSGIAINAAGTGYVVGDVITVPNAGTATVATIGSNGEIKTITSTLSTDSSTTDMAGTKIAGTGGTGTGATFDVTSTSKTSYTIDTITLNDAGSGYAANDVITIGNDGTYKVLTVVDASSIGTILTATFVLDTTSQKTDMAGTNIAGTGGTGKGATFDVTSKTSGNKIEHAMTIHNRTVQTWEGNVYPWNVNGSTDIGHANLSTKAS